MKISVIICTYNRPIELERAIQSVLANTYSDYELLIVDQSEGEQTKKIVHMHTANDSRVKYLRFGRGKSKALNLAIKHALGEIIAFTDDDCVVSTDWLKRIEIVFDRFKADQMIVFGSVQAAKHNTKDGFIPDNRIQAAEFKGPLSIKKVSFGIVGMNMIVKKNFFENVGYFDEILGPGAELKAAEEYDLTYRALKKGLKIFFIPDIKVEHYGLKRWPEAISIFNGYVLGTIAAFCKHIRCMDFNALLLLLISPFIDLFDYTKSLFRRKLGIFQLLYTLTGMYIIYFISFFQSIIKSSKFAVDKKNMVYIKN